MSQKFLSFSAFRITLFVILAMFITFLAVAGQNLYYFYFGSGNTYIYTKNDLAVHFVDVGHGLCTFIQLPDGKIAAFDGGKDEYWPRVNQYIRTRIRPKRNYFDYVINSHPHSDHLDGLRHIMQSYRYGEFLNYENITEGMVLSGADYRIQFHAVGGTVQIDPNVDPDSQDLNEYSPIVTLEYFNSVFVLTGDAGFETETRFLESDTGNTIFGGGKADNLTTYLQVGHHGSASATGSQFLDFIEPKFAVISVGTLYNLPSQTTLSNLDSHGVTTYLTRDSGNIVFRLSPTAEKTFFGFSNPPDLTALWLALYLCICIFPFVIFPPQRGGGGALAPEGV